jgi:hypothetical protein
MLGIAAVLYGEITLKKGHCSGRARCVTLLMTA